MKPRRKPQLAVTSKRKMIQFTKAPEQIFCSGFSGFSFICARNLIKLRTVPKTARLSTTSKRVNLRRWVTPTDSFDCRSHSSWLSRLKIILGQVPPGFPRFAGSKSLCRCKHAEVKQSTTKIHRRNFWKFQTTCSAGKIPLFTCSSDVWPTNAPARTSNVTRTAMRMISTTGSGTEESLATTSLGFFSRFSFSMLSISTEFVEFPLFWLPSKIGFFFSHLSPCFKTLSCCGTVSDVSAPFSQPFLRRVRARWAKTMRVTEVTHTAGSHGGSERLIGRPDSLRGIGWVSCKLSCKSSKCHEIPCT